MKFTTWQIDKLRRGVDDYRTVKGTRDRALSFFDVSKAILRRPESSSDKSTDSDSRLIHEEALRRFVKGNSILKESKLYEVKKFLIYEGIFVEEDFIEEPQELGEMKSVHRFLGNESRTLREICFNGSRNYTANRSIASGFGEKIKLMFYPTNYDCVWAAEEVYQYEKIEEGLRNSVGVDRQITERRIGYAFRATRLNLLYVFLRGAMPFDRINYFEARGTPFMPLGDSSNLLMLRSGDSSVLDREENNEEVFRRKFNIYQFVKESVIPKDAFIFPQQRRVLL